MTAGDAPPRAGLSFERMALGLLFVALALRALLMPAQSDTFWLLRDGTEILRAHAIPRAEAYSFTAAGAPYTDHEWLSEVLLALGHRWGGMPGMELVAGAAVIGAMVLVDRLMVGRPLTRFAILAAALSLASCVWALRPMVFTLFAVCLLSWLLARERFRWLPLLFFLWANAHGGVVVGGLVLAAASAAALARWRLRGEASDRRRVVALAVAVPLSGLATLATPLGANLFAYVAETARRGAVLQISEWDPPRPTDLLGVLFWLVAAAFWVVVIRRGRRLVNGSPDGSWADWVTVVGAVALFPLAVRSLRNMAPFLMLAAPAASRLLGPDFRLRRAAPPASPDHPALNLALLIGASVAAAAVLIAGWTTGAGPLDWRPLPAAALQAARGCPGPLYNDYETGGYLIWFLPGRPVFIDNRQDPYPLPFLLDDVAVEQGARSYQPLFERWGIRCAILNADTRLGRALRDGGWAARYRDRRWAVLVPPAR